MPLRRNANHLIHVLGMQRGSALAALLTPNLFDLHVCFSGRGRNALCGKQGPEWIKKKKEKKESDMELCRITRVHPHLSASLHTADIRLGQYFQFSLSVHCGSPIHTRKSEIALFFSLLLMDIKV